VAPKRNVFLDENLAAPTIKKSKQFYHNLKYQFKNTHTWPKTLQKDILSHMSFTTSAGTSYNFLQSNVVYYLWRQLHLPPDKSENDQDSDSR
jgi:hypothetical protein